MLIYRASSLILLFFLTQITAIAQSNSVIVSGIVRDKSAMLPLPFVNVVLKSAIDSTFVSGTVADTDGRFSLTGIVPGNYLLELSFVGYENKREALHVGKLSNYLNLGSIDMLEKIAVLNEVVITSSQDAVNSKMDKKSFLVADNIAQAGGSVLQLMQNLPGITTQDGKVQLRGNDKITVLIDGKQTALTGFGGQSNLDNIPASAIEKIEIINNPSAKYDANGNAGIINIVYKKNKQEGFNGKLGLANGYGALWIKKANLPSIRPQYRFTPKLNPSLALNYRKNKINAFFQGDYLYTQTLNKNEFVSRIYNDGTVINQQTKRNRNTAYLSTNLGFDWFLNDNNTFSVSGLFASEKILDNGDQPFFNENYSERIRLWQFLEDELKTTATALSTYQHKFTQPGHLLNVGFNYTYHRENEKYFFDNIQPTYRGRDAFKLISDEHVTDLNIDYTRPLKQGKIEGGLKFRKRIIPTNMQFLPGINSPLDTNAGGAATYKETIPALYGNYVFENQKFEAEVGLRVEYVAVNYLVNPNHNTYQSNGYNYIQPFPNLRLAFKVNDRNKISLFYNRRVDRPNEVDIRIFPKYDDAEIIKVGNPALRPQFTNSVELAYKTTFSKGYLYAAAYHRFANGTITRISSTIPGSPLIYAIFQNAGKSYNTGVELVFSRELSKQFSFNVNLNVYRNQINAFTVQNKYPQVNTFSAAQQQLISGNLKFNAITHLNRGIDVQLTAIYLAPDIIPQGNISSRFSLDIGAKKALQNGRGELFVNATDLLNTMRISKQIQGMDFRYTTTDYYETQVIRLGYSYKF